MKKPPTIKVSKTITSFLSRIDAIISFITRKNRLITKDSANSLHSKTYYSSQKIKESIDFEFMPVKSVIKEVCVFYKKDYSSPPV